MDFILPFHFIQFMLHIYIYVCVRACVRPVFLPDRIGIIAPPPMFFAALDIFFNSQAMNFSDRKLFCLSSVFFLCVLLSLKFLLLT